MTSGGISYDTLSEHVSGATAAISLLLVGVLSLVALIRGLRNGGRESAEGESTPVDEDGGTQTRKSSSAAEENDTVPSRAATPTIPSRRRARAGLAASAPLKDIYSNIVGRRRDAASKANEGASNAVATTFAQHFPRLLQRRHSTAFPAVVQGKFTEKIQAARDLFRRSGGYRRQMSEICRVTLPQPPSEFFEPSAEKEIPDEFKPMFYIHHNLKLLELPSDWALDPDHIEVLEFQPNQYVARPGDADDSIYVVLKGTLAVYISPPEVQGKEYMVKRIGQGNSFFSLLSMIDLLMQAPSTLKTVSLRATEETKVAKYNMARLRGAYESCPALWMRPIQITVSRLLHVTMTTLHQQMGLGEELLRRRMDEASRGPAESAEFRKRNASGHSMKNPAGKPFRPRHRRMSSSDEGTEQISRATRIIAEVLRLPACKAESLLQPRIELVQLDEGQAIVEQGSDANASLFVCLNGALKLSQESPFESEDGGFGGDEQGFWQRLIPPREVLGGLQLLSNEPSFFTVKAASPNTTIARINKENFEQLVELTEGSIVLPVAYTVLRRLSPFLRAVDFAIDWVLLDSGQTVYRDGDLAESLFVVLSGRLRSVSNKVAIEEFGRGDVLGMMEVLQKRPRSTTVLAIRYSQLARIPEGLLNFIKMQYPQVGFRLVRLLGQYYYNDNRRLPNGTLPGLAPSSALHSVHGSDPMSQIKNLHTICVFAASDDVPLTAFTCELYHALNASTKVLRLSSQRVAECLGESVLEKQADFRLMHWLNTQEDNFAILVYECDSTMSNWTRRCLRQADAILVVANGEVKPPHQLMIDEHFRLNRDDGIRTRKELVLLWRDDVDSPEGTVEWLKGSWFSAHHHVRTPKRMYQWEPKSDGAEELSDRSEQAILDYYESYVFTGKADFNSDFSRLSRVLTGNAVGLVLGGGGAKGAAHVGIIKALREHGIPVDIVGGTSIGALLGGIYAGNHPAEYQNQDLATRASTWFTSMCSLWKKLLDLTWSYTSMFTGAGFNNTIRNVLGEKLIEDLWLPYFCISTDINASEMRVHRSGSLWSYVRASMSLAGYLPPLCDPADGHYLLDGGYVNNLPADVMRSMGARCIIAVDVGAADEVDLYNYGDSLSGFWVLANVLLQKINPWAKPIRILGMEEIQSRLAFVSSARQLDLVKKANYCHYLRPPWLERYKTLDFYKFDEISALGYDYGSAKLSELVKTNANIKSVMNPDKLRILTRMSTLRKDSPTTRNSFTDLAARLSRIPAKLRSGSLSNLSNLDWDFEDIAAELQLRRKKLENGHSEEEYDEDEDEEDEEGESEDEVYVENRVPIDDGLQPTSETDEDQATSLANRRTDRHNV